MKEIAKKIEFIPCQLHSDRKSYKLECKGWWKKAGSEKIIGVFGEKQGGNVEYKCFVSLHSIKYGRKRSLRHY